jgi:hypothetical protein
MRLLDEWHGMPGYLSGDLKTALQLRSSGRKLYTDTAQGELNDKKLSAKKAQLPSRTFLAG